MRYRVCQLFIMLLLYAGSLQSQPFRLIDCQEKAHANYPLIKQYDPISKSTEFTVSNAGKAYLPQVSVTAIGGISSRDFRLWFRARKDQKTNYSS